MLNFVTSPPECRWIISPSVFPEVLYNYTVYLLLSSFNQSSFSCLYVATPPSSTVFALGAGEELIWNLTSDSAALLAELDTLFVNDPGSSDGEGVLTTGCLMLTGVHGVKGLGFFVFC